MPVLLDEGGVPLLDEGGVPLMDEAGGSAPSPTPTPTARWTWVLADSTGIALRQLTRAVNRSLVLRLDAPCTAQFTIDGRSDEAAQIIPLATDLIVYRDGVKMFRGRIGPESDEVDETQHRSSFSAIDYRGMLRYRHVGVNGQTFTSTEQAAIAFSLINDSQSLDGGNWGISDAGTVTGQLRDRTYDPGKSILDAITELGNVDNGFDWEVDPDLSFNVYYPQRGVDNGVVLDYGGKVTRFSRTLDPADFGNAAMAAGSSGLTPVMVESVDVATDPRGRWEVFQAYPSVLEQSTVSDKATWLLSNASVLRPEYRMTLARGRWSGLSDVGVGDTVGGAFVSGRLVEVDSYRVAEISCSPGDDGTETITMGLVRAS